MTALCRVGGALAALLSTVTVGAAAPHDAAFVAWAKAHAVPLPACASIRSGADYRAVAGALGEVRVVALGEPVHGAHEPLALRNCLFRYLVEEQDRETDLEGTSSSGLVSSRGRRNIKKKKT